MPAPPGGRRQKADSLPTLSSPAGLTTRRRGKPAAGIARAFSLAGQGLAVDLVTLRGLGTNVVRE